MPKTTTSRRRKAQTATTQTPFSSCLPRLPVLSAAMLDRLADAELQHGHIARAEWLAQRAEALREAVR